MPEQEFLPPRPSARSYRPDPDDEDPPPWANLPPVRPVRQQRPPGAGYPAGPGRPAGGAPTPPPPSYRPDPAGPAGVRYEDPAPPWAGPEAEDGEDAPAAQPRAQPRAQLQAEPREPGGRALRAAARKRRRWLVLAGGLAVVTAAAIGAVLLTSGGPGPAAVTPGALITTFQPGELQQVPDACRVVPAATVQHYLPGKIKVASPLPVNGAAESACNWTVDQAPRYRLMELNLFAYAPNGLASGNGSATFAAIDDYDSTLRVLANPPPHSPSPRATVTMLPGFGNQAFSALQVFRRGGAVTDVATVVVRFHNVVVTATLNGLEHSNRGSYGPVSASALSAAALAFAQSAEASLH